jgi:FkbM family methyltransferase
MVENTRRYPNISGHKIALGSSNGQATIYLFDQSVTSSLIEPDNAKQSEVVGVLTVGTFVENHDIERIDLLKIDAEGFDLEVLKGANNTIACNRVPFILV